MQSEKVDVGDLVKWFDYYADGDIVKDAGLGIVLRIIERPDPPHTHSYFAHELYLIQRMDKVGQHWYADHSLDLVAKAVQKNAQKYDI